MILLIALSGIISVVSLLLLFGYPVVDDGVPVTPRLVRTPQEATQAIEELGGAKLPARVFPHRVVRKTLAATTGKPNRIPDTFERIDLLFPFPEKRLTFVPEASLSPVGIFKALSALGDFQAGLLNEKLVLLDEQRQKVNIEKEKEVIAQALDGYNRDKEALLAALRLYRSIMENNQRVLNFLGLEEDEELFYLQ